MEATLSDGAVGWGEASFFGREIAVLHALDRIATALPLPAWAPVLSGFRPPQEARVAASGVEQAVLAALASRSGLPLAAWLGPVRRSLVPVYANINRGVSDRSPAGFAAAARAVKGCDAFKIAPFDGLRWDAATLPERHRLLDEGIARVAALREAVGPEARIMVDCHWRFDLALARRAIEGLAALDIAWIEDPVDPATTTPRERRLLRDAAHAPRHAAGRWRGGVDARTRRWRNCAPAAST